MVWLFEELYRVDTSERERRVIGRVAHMITLNCLIGQITAALRLLCIFYET